MIYTGCIQYEERSVLNQTTHENKNEPQRSVKTFIHDGTLGSFSPVSIFDTLLNLGSCLLKKRKKQKSKCKILIFLFVVSSMDLSGCKPSICFTITKALGAEERRIIMEANLSTANVGVR